MPNLRVLRSSRPLSWLLLAGALPLAAQAPPPATALAQRVQPILHARFPASGEPPTLLTATGSFRAAPDLSCFYERRSYAPAWIGEKGVRPDADDLIAALADAPADGLDPERYRLADLRQRLAQGKGADKPGDLAELDLRLTDAFLRLATDLRNGAVNPQLIAPDCELDIPEVDLSAALEKALAAGRVRPALAELAPAHAGYKALKGALAQMRTVAARGGWPTVPDGPPLKPGDRGDRVAALRARLEASGELAPEAPASTTPAPRDLFDAPLQAALIRFQDLHGLDPDGHVGKGTLAALDVTVEQRIRQIEVNLDRWRWLPHDLGERYIMVNIAGFTFDLVEAGHPALSMRVVAGKVTNRTPMFTGRMTNIVLNPYWNVPASIAKKEVIPHMERDPGYLEREGLEVTGSGSSLEVRQKPGPKNALGRVKFLFPNRFDVYLHDTPSRSLFSRTVRSFSHGCIRVEKPIELAEYLLKDDPAWTPKRIAAVIARGKEAWVNIPHPLPVHLVYWTAWVDDAGILQLRDDLYGRDKPLMDVLGTEAPAQTAAP
ncbi:MAG TPA: L,D-transpeptidase family protein [Thermoanaerobaculia bacterium]|nr:L,D-transpeptidase family protein [Thermoanaerobaculia bacterium]